jgi:hypothetical protein
MLVCVYMYIYSTHDDCVVVLDDVRMLDIAQDVNLQKHGLLE